MYVMSAFLQCKSHEDFVHLPLLACLCVAEIFFLVEIAFKDYKSVCVCVHAYM